MNVQGGTPAGTQRFAAILRSGFLGPSEWLHCSRTTSTLTTYLPARIMRKSSELTASPATEGRAGDVCVEADNLA